LKWLEFDVQAQAGNENWSSITVITGIVDVLQIQGGINSAPEVERVVCLFDILSPVVEATVPQQKTKSSESQVRLMIARNGIGNKRESHAVRSSVPGGASGAQTKEKSLVVFRIRIGFVVAFVPSKATENSQPIVQRLLKVQSETVFDGGPG
jgi:hypothetical protein